MREIIIFDGAMGTELMKYGLKWGQCAEAFNIHKPEVIKDIHKRYLEAGADIITTNTFGANSANLSKKGYEVEAIIKRALKLANEAVEEYKVQEGIENQHRGSIEVESCEKPNRILGSRIHSLLEEKKKLVAFDLGPTAMLPPYGNMSEEEVEALFEEQVISADKDLYDIVLIETMLSLKECILAIKAVKKHCDKPIICTFTFSEEGETLSNESIEDIVSELSKFNIDSLGANCSFGPIGMQKIAKEFLKSTELPIIVQPNAGLPKKVNNQNVYDMTPEEFKGAIIPMIDEGISIIGGCCGTNYEYIKELATIREK